MENNAPAAAALADALAAFRSVFAAPGPSVAAHMTCGEVEAFAGVLEALGEPDAAAAAIKQHAANDSEPEDDHYAA